MVSPIRRWFSSLSALAVLAVGAYSIYWFFERLLRQLNTMTTDNGRAIVTATAAVTASVVTVVVGKVWEQKVKLREELHQRKQPVYEAQIHLLLSVMSASREGQESPSEAQIFQAFREFTEKLLIWGGPDVIKAWASFRLHDWPGGTSPEGFLKFEQVVRAMRAELGNKNTGLPPGELLRIFINDIDMNKLQPTPTVPQHADGGNSR